MRIAIVGGGIGGLAAALLLRRAGLDATVYEQACELREVGAGIVVAPNMVRPLRTLGLEGQLERIAVRLEAAWEFRRWQNGEVLFSQPMGEECERRYGAHCYVAHRADLHALLLRAFGDQALRLDHRCVAVTQTSDEATIEFANANGRTHRVAADVVIGADGIHSEVQRALMARVDARFSELSAFRCVVPADQAPEMARRPVQTLWLGPGKHAVHYPISAGREVNIVAIVAAGDWRSESWTADGDVADMMAEFVGWDERLVELLDAAVSTKRWAMYDREPLDRWSDGRVTLLGDAAHAMLPFFAQGAAQALEDAVVLAQCLQRADRGSVAEALLRYESIRIPRSREVQLLSRGREVQNHLPDGAAQRARDAALANGNPLEQSAWLYGHDLYADL